MDQLSPIHTGLYSHDLLLHECDDELLEGTRAFVEQGLASGGKVLVHGTPERVAMMRAALHSHPRLDFGLDRDLYTSPSSTLFAYQRMLAESPDPVELWATGTVPLGDDPAGHPAWARYESAVNESLRPYAFHGLCTYDTRTLPAATVAAARATHPCLSTGGRRTLSPDYQDPADFLANPVAAVPDPPVARPVAMATVGSPLDLSDARHVLKDSAECSSALARHTIDAFVSAVNEVLVNGLEHGGTRVLLTVWAEMSRLTCLVTDTGPGITDPLSGYGYPAPTGPRGLWMARQLCEDIFISDQPGAGCRVLLTTA